MATLTPQEREIAIKATTKAIGYAENGGAPNVNNPSAGKTGELKSIFQFEPATWKAFAKEYLGNADAPVTPDNETTVVMKRVGERLDEGYTVKQIASEWNSGDKDAYTGKFTDGSPSVGVNEKYGVKFNVPAYANTVNNYAKQFYTQMQQTPNTPSPQPQSPATPSSSVATTMPPNQGYTQPSLGNLSGLLPSLAQPSSS